VLYRQAISSLAADPSQREMLAKTLIQGLTGVIPVIYNSSIHSTEVRKEFISNLMILDHEYRDGVGGIASKDQEVIEYASSVREVQLTDPLNALGCSSLGYAHSFH
jgi:hypothetical protein